VLVSVTVKSTVVDVPPESWMVLLSIVAPLIWRVTMVDPVIPVLVSLAEMEMELPGHVSLGFMTKLLALISGMVAGGAGLGLVGEDGRGGGEGEGEGEREELGDGEDDGGKDGEDDWEGSGEGFEDLVWK